MDHAPDLSDIEAAGSRLAGVIRDLPPLRARWIEERVGGPVALMTENLQRAGSFKVRGACNRMVQLTPAERSRGVVAASAGNHGQGVAFAAQRLGIPATVFMPAGATIPKVQATRGYGARVEFAGATVDEAVDAAQRDAERSGAVFIHPFDHPDVIAGQGTLGLEIVAKVPDVRTIVVCTGGGGLLAGVALAAKARRPGVRVVGVQADQAAAYPASLAAGEPRALAAMATMADGIAVAKPGVLPFAIVRDLVDGVMTVSEEEISRAVLQLLERAKLLVEPAGAVAAAAVLGNPAAFEPPVAIVLSGGNVDPLVLLRILRHGLVAAGRYLAVSVRLPDTPGSLARLLADVRTTRSNVLDVTHDRIGRDLGVDEVDIVIQLETRGDDHCAEVLSALQSAGYAVRRI